MAALGASQSTPDAFYLSEESGCPAQSSAGGHLVVGPSFIGRSDALIRVYRNRSKRSCFFAVGVGLRAGECGVSVCERVYPRDLHINPVTSIPHLWYGRRFQISPYPPLAHVFLFVGAFGRSGGRATLSKTSFLRSKGRARSAAALTLAH